MHPERWTQVNALFDAAVDLEPGRRSAFLDESCSGDQKLRAEVEALLESDEFSWDFIETPALEVAAPLLTDEEPQLQPGATMGRYRVIQLIGEGGMGEVYLAADEKLHRQVALKLLPIDYTRDKHRLRRFEQEARAASALNHPNILTIHELGETNG
ncbi:MAG: serine/threonine protein kinase, partial [Pyrinomonadaceae bacterium]